MMSQHKELQATVEGLVMTLDTAMFKVIWGAGHDWGGEAAFSCEQSGLNLNGDAATRSLER